MRVFYPIKQLSLWLFTSAICLLPSAMYSQLTLTPSLNDATCPTDSNGSISVVVSGGTAPYTYQWTPGGDVTSSVTGLVPGIYSVIVTDNGGTTSSGSYTIGPSPFSDNSQIEMPFCTSNGSIVLFPSGATSPYQYAWNTGSTVQGITSAGAGNYSVVLTDANTCTVTFSYMLTEEECYLDPEPYFTPNGDNINDVWFVERAQYFDNIHVIVFDRWGTRVHEQRGMYVPWNGKNYLGISVPSAVYYYFFYQDKEDKQKEALSGSVTIMR